MEAIASFRNSFRMIRIITDQKNFGYNTECNQNLSVIFIYARTQFLISKLKRYSIACFCFTFP